MTIKDLAKSYLNLKRLRGGLEPKIAQLSQEWNVTEAEAPILLTQVKKYIAEERARQRKQKAKSTKSAPVSAFVWKRSRSLSIIMLLSSVIAIITSIALSFSGYIGIYGPLVAWLLSALFPIAGAGCFTAFFYFHRNRMRWFFLAGWFVISLYSLVTISQGLNEQFRSKSTIASTEAYNAAQSQLSLLKAEATNIQTQKQANAVLWKSKTLALQNEYATLAQQQADPQGYANVLTVEAIYRKRDAGFADQLQKNAEAQKPLLAVAAKVPQDDFFTYAAKAMNIDAGKLRLFIQAFPALILDLISSLCFYGFTNADIVVPRKKEEQENG